jgi:hypothetical protein
MRRIFAVLGSFVVCLTLGADSDSARSRRQHSEILDPAPFVDDRTSYVAYTVASKIPETLAKQPCFCPCHFLHGHKSLLDCFAGQHGRECSICKQEAIFCYQQRLAGKCDRQIRKGLKSGAWIQINLETFAQEFMRSQGQPR